MICWLFKSFTVFLYVVSYFGGEVSCAFCCKGKMVYSLPCEPSFPFSSSLGWTLCVTSVHMLPIHQVLTQQIRNDVDKDAVLISIGSCRATFRDLDSLAGPEFNWLTDDVSKT